VNGQQRPRVFVGVDRSPAGLAALRYAVDEARRRGAVLYAVHADRTLGSQDRTVIDAAFREVFGGPPPGVEVCREPVIADPAELLRRRADRPTDLVVVGVRKHGPLGLLRRRPTSRAVLRGARCSVVAVPAPRTR
jgi:nucleotide-binding universal stress UspA family protein